LNDEPDSVERKRGEGQKGKRKTGEKEVEKERRGGGGERGRHGRRG
jgi:hypothetical protein